MQQQAQLVAVARNKAMILQQQQQMNLQAGGNRGFEGGNGSGMSAGGSPMGMGMGGGGVNPPPLHLLQTKVSFIFI